MEYKDYYQTLGVAKNATAEEIKKAYRKLMRKHHPDVNQAQDASDQAKEVNEAYDVLGNAEKRAAYNARSGGAPGGRPFQPRPAWGANDNVEGDDFFFDLFAHAGQRSRQAGAYNMRGDDIHASISIDLADAYNGATRTVTLRVPQRDASGKVVNRERSFEVAIPRGVLAGQQLRVPRQGYQGSGRGAPGDLFLDIVFNPDPLYRVEERDVFARLAITPWEAALGAQIDVPTPCGQVQVSVPAGSQGGRKLRLKGRGIPAHPPGDLYLTLEVVLPPASSPEARALYQTMARDLAFNPRAGVRA